MKKLFLTAFVLLGFGLVSQAQTKHYIGEMFGGGVVFDLSADSLHGLIAETIDQGANKWEQAMVLANTGKHSEAGKAFTDWYLPSKDELAKLFIKKRIVGGFTAALYWSSKSFADSAWNQHFGSGGQGSLDKKQVNFFRAIRAF